MPDDAIFTPPADSIPTSTPSTPDSAGAHVAGAGAIDPASALAQRLNRASADAVDQHLAESPKKSRGQRGPDKRPRAPRAKNAVPLEDVGAGPGQTPLEEGTPEPLAGVVVERPAFDKETARTLVEIAVDLLNDGASAIVRAIAKNQTGDRLAADEAAKEVRMGEKIEKTIKTGGVACCEKYAVRMEYAPETMLFGGLVLWIGQVLLMVKALKAKGAELRADAEKRKVAA